MDNNKIVVTGGAGFLGSHLCKYLLEKGEHVLCVDDLSTGSMKNIEPFMENDNFSFIKGDVTVPGWMFAVDCKEIYNLACPASPVNYQENPAKTLRSSVVGVLNMLDLAHINDAKLLQASTSEVYGSPTEHPQTESYWGNVNPIGIRSCYDEGKRAAETALFDCIRGNIVDGRIARIFNTYGPNMAIDDGRVVSNFIIQALRGEDITIYGDGSHTRSFCYVDDLIEGIYRLMNQSFSGPINIGNPKEVTIKELAKKVIKLTGSKSKIIYLDLPQDDPPRRKPDITLARQRLNWEPTIELEDGLKRTIEYFKKELEVK